MGGRTIEVHADGVHSGLTSSDSLLKREQCRSKSRNPFFLQPLGGSDASTGGRDLDT